MYMYHHHVSGIFQHHEEAMTALRQLKERGLPLKRIQLFENKTTLARTSAPASSYPVLKNILVMGLAGSLRGLGLGALAQVALTATDSTLISASTIIAPQTMLGWGATLGGMVGAFIGAMQRHRNSYQEKEGWFSNLLNQAIAKGQVVLVVETLNRQETTLAGNVMKLSVNNYEDVEDHAE